MGCDIHFYVEKRVDGKWTPADKWQKDEDDENRLHVPYKKSFYSGRNYDLFAILAGVRNGRGFAGVETGDGFTPIDDPRGLPDDVCAEISEASEHYGIDGHSHSFFTVEELLAYDWTQETGHTGWVKYDEWVQYKIAGKPDNWADMISGGAIVHRTPANFELAAAQVRQTLKDDSPTYWWQFRKDEYKEEMLKILAPGKEPVVCVRWTEPYYVSAGDFLSQTMPRLWGVGRPEDVRCVFWFDN